MNKLDKYAMAIKKICVVHQVKTVYAFGSVLTNNFTEKSDIDFIVDFDPVKLSRYADNYFNFKFSLQNIFKRNIDLFEEKANKNPYFL